MHANPEFILFYCKTRVIHAIDVFSTSEYPGEKQRTCMNEVKYCGVLQWSRRDSNDGEARDSSDTTAVSRQSMCTSGGL